MPPHLIKTWHGFRNVKSREILKDIGIGKNDPFYI